jgi:hypothetical protein
MIVLGLPYIRSGFASIGWRRRKQLPEVLAILELTAIFLQFRVDRMAFGL